MVKYTKKNVDISYEIKKYALEKKKFSYSEITTDLRKFGTEKTIFNNLKPFLINDWIQHNVKTKKYSINPFIKTWDKDPDLQIKEGKEKAIKLLRAAKKNEEHFDKSITVSINREFELRRRVMRNSDFSFNFRNKNLNQGCVFDEETMHLQEDLVYSLIRNCFLFAPETWKLIKGLKYIDFEFNIKANLSKDPEIFNIYNDLREVFMEHGVVFHSISAPFNISNILEIPKEKKDKIETFFHKNAFYYDKFERNRLIENKKKIEQELHKILISSSELLKIIKDLELVDLDYKSFEILRKFFITNDRLKNFSTNNDILEIFKILNIILKNFKEKITINELKK